MANWDSSLLPESKLSRVVLPHFNALDAHQLFWEAATIFSIACSRRGKQDAPNSFRVRSWYKRLMSSIDVENIGNAASFETRDEVDRCLCALATNTALLKLIAHHRQNTVISSLDRQNLQFLRNWLEAVHSKLFRLVRNHTPRGSYVNLWSQIWLYADNIVVENIHQTQSSGVPQNSPSKHHSSTANNCSELDSIAIPTTATEEFMKRTTKIPEYIDVPWTDLDLILEDLYPLCKIIDAQIGNGRRVLIYSKLGSHRSAAIVAAYGLFKGFQSDVDSAIDTVKRRSKWVVTDPILSYDLEIFRSRIAKFPHDKADSWWFWRLPEMLVPFARSTAASYASYASADILDTRYTTGPIRIYD